jgi:hypothetical protein
MILVLFFSKLRAVGFSCHSSIPQIPEQRGGPLQYEGILPQILTVYLIFWYSNRFPNIFSLVHRTSALVKTGSAVRRPVKLWIEKSRCWTGYLAVSKGISKFCACWGRDTDSFPGSKIHLGHRLITCQLKSFRDCCHLIYSTTFDEGTFPSLSVRARTTEFRNLCSSGRASQVASEEQAIWNWEVVISIYIPDMPEFYLWTNLKTYSHEPLRIDPTSGVAVGSQGLFSHWVDGKERSRQVGRIWRRSSCSSRAPWLGFKFSITDARRTSQVFKPFTLW